MFAFINIKTWVVVMELVVENWTTVLKPDSQIPPDVKRHFQKNNVVHEDKEYEALDRGDGGYSQLECFQNIKSSQLRFKPFTQVSYLCLSTTMQPLT